MHFASVVFLLFCVFFYFRDSYIEKYDGFLTETVYILDDNTVPSSIILIIFDCQQLKMD